MNKRITPRERGLLKGAIRRVFARSELRQSVVDSREIKHSDPKHPRVKRWSSCAICLKPTPRYKIVVDHMQPVIPTNSSFEDMSIDNVLDRMWCDPTNLQAICETCHDSKTALERAERKLNRKGKKDETKRTSRSRKNSSKRNPSRTTKRTTLRRAQKARR